MAVRAATQADYDAVADAILNRMQEMASSTQEERQVAERKYEMVLYTGHDGVDPETGLSPRDSMQYRQTAQRMRALDEKLKTTGQLSDAEWAEVAKTAFAMHNMEAQQARRQMPTQDAQPASPQTVREKIINQPVGEVIDADYVEQVSRGVDPADTPLRRKAKSFFAKSKRTEVHPQTEQILYGKDRCTSNGQSFDYKRVMKKVDWADDISRYDNLEDAMDSLSAYVTRMVYDSYGGWNRITEIVVRDQQLIINRTCCQPILDPHKVNPANFPLDTIDYLRAGAIASFFDWGTLKNMRNLQLLDVDDMGFYELNIGSSLKCGRRIGVSTIFNICRNLEVLILGGDMVTRDSLDKPEGVAVKKKLATHKRFHLFADGYKMNVLQNSRDFSSWTFNNMRNYAANRGDKNLFIYLGGVTTRAAVAGAAGVFAFGSHLIGGIAGTIKEAMTPITPEEAGLDKPTKP